MYNTRVAFSRAENTHNSISSIIALNAGLPIVRTTRLKKRTNSSSSMSASIDESMSPKMALNSVSLRTFPPCFHVNP